MNALELADSRKEWANDLLSLNEWSIDAEKMLRKLEGQLAFRIDAIKSYQIKVEQQQAEILAGKIMIKGYSKTIDEQQAEMAGAGTAQPGNEPPNAAAGAAPAAAPVAPAAAA